MKTTPDSEVQAALATVLGGLLSKSQAMRRSENGYKLLFAAFKDGGLARAMFEAERRMSHVAMDLASVIKDQTGKAVDNELWDVMLGLPLAIGLLRRDIEATEGNSCCMDKARLTLKTYFYDKLGMDVEAIEAPRPVGEQGTA